MASKNLSGVITPLITPFDQNGDVNFELVKKEIRILLEAGVDAISPGGSTGEGALLADEELVALIHLIRETDKDIPIVAGVIRNSTRAAVKTALCAKEAGADALMITPVSYTALVPDDEGNYNFYETISKQVGLPIIIYNVVPQNQISAPLFVRLLDIEHVYGIKQACGGVAACYEMRMYAGNRGKVYGATDDMLFTTYELGANGAISAALSVFPDICVDMWKSYQKGDRDRGMMLQKKIYFVWQAIQGKQFPIRMKYALKLMGRDAGYTRSPICHISEKDKLNIERALRESGFIL
ncbi:MAG: dihydrodipicolinate synthase family protein [Christensenellales bacterium]